MDNPDDVNGLWFHGGSGPGYLEDEARGWYEKQCLFKYYHVRTITKPS